MTTTVRMVYSRSSMRTAMVNRLWSHPSQHRSSPFSTIMRTMSSSFNHNMCGINTNNEACRIDHRDGKHIIVTRYSPTNPHVHHNSMKSFVSKQRLRKIHHFSTKASSARVEEIFQKILQLDFVEVNLLGQVVYEKLGMDVSGASLLGGASKSGGGTAGQQQQPEKVEEKTEFDLKLTGFDAKAKIKVIKEIRAITGLGLKDAKQMVEGAPNVVKTNLKKEEAEELKAKLESLGATVELE